MKNKDILDLEVPTFTGQSLQEGVYFAVIKDVELINEDKIKVTFDLTLDDDSTYTLYLKTNLVPKHSWDMINRLVQACRTRKVKDFIDCEVWVSVVINEVSESVRFENVQDVIYTDSSVDDFEYELSEKGYFIR